MVAKKCVKCKKSVTKKVPGLECNRCEVIVHADPACSSLSNKQLSTLRNSSSFECSCQECLKNITRRSSFMIPEDDGDEEEFENMSITNISPVIDTKKLVQDISRELKKTFREEISGLENSLEYLSEQLASLEKSTKLQDLKIKDLENKNYDLHNKNKNLELRVSALEQGLKTFEQENIASKLEVDKKDIQATERQPGSKDKPGTILVELKSKIIQQQWVASSKEKCLTVGLVAPNIQREHADRRIFIREALTKHLKSLLYEATTQLRDKSCQYVWCKNGKIFARQTNNSKIYHIRNVNDILQIAKLKSNKSVS
ncbi:hypothetical protein ACJJTC_004596 [Scirpophaga incertulas]